MDCKAQQQKDKQKEGSPRIVRNVLGESSTAPQPTVVGASPQKQLALQTQEVVAQASEGLSTLEEGKVSKECKDMEDYPFRQEIEDLVKSPLRTT